MNAAFPYAGVFIWKARGMNGFFAVLSIACEPVGAGFYFAMIPTQDNH